MDSSPPLSLKASPVQLKDGLTTFRVWAPKCNSLELELLRGEQADLLPMQIESDGFLACSAEGIKAGDRYQYVLNGQVRRPDPKSNFQPAGVHGPSQVVDHSTFHWTDRDWQGVPKSDLVIYELHVGTFSSSGTYQGVIDKLPRPKELGITAIELLPLAQCPGAWNWGYDGVNLFAPSHNYGTPDDLKSLVNACHEQGIAIFLDVVYNHLGPEGNYLSEFGPYFSSKHHTPWGDAFNFDDESCSFVRAFVTDNVRHWLDDYHFDGLRLDAVHFMFDDRRTHILHEIAQSVNALQTGLNRQLHLIAEANVFDASLLAPASTSPPYTAIWCDCLMHSLYAQALPNLRLAHRSYYGGKEIYETLDRGYLYKVGNPHPVRVSALDDERNKLADLRTSFVTSLQTHDSVGNHPTGQRLHQVTSLDYQRAAAALVLLQPSIPQIFMGEESSHSSPFPFFVNFEDPNLQRAVEQGRAREYPQHEWDTPCSPIEESTFRNANLDAGQGDSVTWTWYRQLLELRRRGLHEKWLAEANLSADYLPADDVFTVNYQTREKTIRILCRLAFSSPASSTSSHVTLGSEFLLLADSRKSNVELKPLASVQLSACHAVVLESA